jgi:hypothetical protein
VIIAPRPSQRDSSPPLPFFMEMASAVLIILIYIADFLDWPMPVWLALVGASFLSVARCAWWRSRHRV